MKKRTPILYRRAAARPNKPKYAARFYQDVPIPVPNTNDPERAAEYASHLSAALSADTARKPDDPKKLTRPERASLIRLLNRWDRRAAGKDQRWTLAGAKSGRLPKSVERQYRKAPDPAWGKETP